MFGRLQNAEKQPGKLKSQKINKTDQNFGYSKDEKLYKLCRSGNLLGVLMIF